MQLIGAGMLMVLSASAPLFAADIADKSLANWPQWRGPTFNGVAPLGDPPVRWSATENLQWKTPIEGRVGFNLLPAKGLLSFVVRAPETEVQPADIDMKVRLNGRLADDTQLGGWRRRFIYEWPEPQVVFVELTATSPKTDEPVNLILRLGR